MLNRLELITILLTGILSSVVCQEKIDGQPKYPYWEPPPGAAGAEPWFPLPTAGPTPGPGLPDSVCNKNIYRGCNRATQFTSGQLSTVLTFLNNTFNNLAEIVPDQPLCPAITVRRDWKCLSPPQRTRVIAAFNAVYANGAVAQLADLYSKFWPAWHESGELFPAHRYLAYQLEAAMRAVDPGVTLPYYCPWTACAHLERSIVWETLGTNGSYSNGYTVSDGIYGDLGLVPSLKRHWAANGDIYPCASPELDTNVLHFGTIYTFFYIAYIGIYYQPLVNVAGFEGQMSGRDAPYDLFFYLKSLCETEVRGIRWQLYNQAHLTPLTYNLINFKFDQVTGQVENANIATDELTGAPGVSIRSLFFLGFGTLCSVPDALIRPINRIVNGTADPVPTAISRMPATVIAKHFPLFMGGNTSALFHTFEEVGDCNRDCLPLPKPTFLGETEAGRRILAEASQRFGELLGIAEQHAYEVWYDLNKYGYCSPYVTP